MTKPPCRPNGTDCPRRSAECKTTCQAWKDWTAIHAEECRAMRRAKEKAADVDGFLARKRGRARSASQARYDEKNRR